MLPKLFCSCERRPQHSLGLSGLGGFLILAIMDVMKPPYFLTNHFSCGVSGSLLVMRLTFSRT